MSHITQQILRIRNDLMIALSLNMNDKPHPTSIFLILWIIQSLTFRKRRDLFIEIDPIESCD